MSPPGQSAADRSMEERQPRAVPIHEVACFDVVGVAGQLAEMVADGAVAEGPPGTVEQLGGPASVVQAPWASLAV
jgi:hypothetical protein